MNNLKKLLLSLVFITSYYTQAETYYANDFNLSDDEFRTVLSMLKKPTYYPSTSFISTTAFGIEPGTISIAAGGATTIDDNYDGSATVSTGIYRNRFIGLTGSINIISLLDPIGADGNIDLKIYSKIGARTSLAIGTKNILPWGQAKTLSSINYISLSHITEDIRFGNTSLGASGTLGIEQSNDFKGIKKYGSASLIFNRSKSLIIDINDSKIGIAASIAPISHRPLVITTGLINLGTANQQFAGSIGYTFTY